MSSLWSHLDKLESYICRVILAVFVTLLFAQITARQIFNYNILWTEELSTILFVCFAYFGASYAARISAHNRVSFHINALPRRIGRVIEALGDAFWVLFNVVFIWKSLEFIGNLKPFMKTPTLGWQLQHVYLILPVAFTLMTIRVIQVNYLKLVKGIDPRDPDKVEVEDMLELVEDERRAFAEEEARHQKESRK